MIRAALLVAMLFAVNACDKPTAEDLRVGRRTMRISEVSLMLRNGYSQKAIVAEVNGRHIPEKISPATEVELTANGAGPVLIAALKDEKNILTRNQKNAHDQWMEGQTMRGLAAQNDAQAQSEAAQKDRPRLLDLQQQNLRNIEKKEQAERDQAAYRSRYETQTTQTTGGTIVIRKRQP